MCNDTVDGYTILEDELEQLNSLFPVLTAKQFKVLHLFAMGIGNKNIADHMSVSEQNIKNHHKTIRTKLNCNTSQDARVLYMTRIVVAVYLNKL